MWSEACVGEGWMWPLFWEALNVNEATGLVKYMLLWLQVVTSQEEIFGSGGGDHVPSASTFAVHKFLGFRVALKTWTLMDPIYRRKFANNFYSKRNSWKSETLIKEFSSENLWSVRWAWFLNLNLKDIEAISCESDPSLRDSVALISHSKQIKYPGRCQSSVSLSRATFFPPGIYFQDMLVIKSWCKYIFLLSKIA